MLISEVPIPKSNFQSSDGCEMIFMNETTEQPLKMSGKVREGNRRGFLARVTKNKRQKKRGKNFMESFGKCSDCEYKKIIFKSRNCLK